jgi:leader peptidase (prepilin peptidase) / N-methyltransferase
MDILALILLTVGGLLVGWVCNVIAQRFPTEDKAIIAPLRCVRCKEKLRWYDSFPLFGWLFQKGKCRYCKKALPVRFPILEFCILFCFVASYYRFMNAPLIVHLVNLFYIALFILIGAIDWKHRLIFPIMVYLGCFVAILVSLFVTPTVLEPFKGQTYLPDNLLSSISGLLFCGIVTLLLYWLGIAAYKIRALGFGDVLLAILIGLSMGFPRSMAALFMGAIFGGLTGAFLLITRKKGLRQYIPYGTGLCAGAVLILTFGDGIWQWGPFKLLGDVLSLLFNLFFRALARIFGLEVS